MCFYVLSSKFLVVMSVTMFAYKRCSVRLYLQLLVGGLMSYLPYLLGFFLCIVVSNTYCVVFLLCFSSSCVHYVASFSGLSIFNYPFVIF
jgi:hypothetical protein